jgi:WD40 repeat protein
MSGVAELSTDLFWSIGLDGHIIDMQWVRSRSFLLAATIDGEIALIDVRAGTVPLRWKAHEFGLASLSVSPVQNRLASCGQDGALRIWDLDDGSLIAESELADQWGVGARYSPSGALIGVAAGRHMQVVSPDGAVVRRFEPLASTISDLAWKPALNDEPECVATCGYGGVHIWRADIDTYAKRFPWQGSALSLAWSPDAKYLATGDQDRTVHFWVVSKAKDLEMTGYPIKVRELAWTADSSLLATGGGADITVWDCSGRGPRGTEANVLEGHQDKINALAFSHTNILASGSDDGEIRLWEPIRHGTSLVTLGVPSSVSRLAWSPDSELLAIGAANGEVHCAAQHLS